MSVNLIMRTGASCELDTLPDYRRRESAHESYSTPRACRTRLSGDVMAVSRRLRFEILRRDQHCCRYCGEHASPQVKLTVDHVLPVALGGTDDPTNLAAACGPCNSGKAASNPDAPLVAQVADDEIRWRRAFASAAKKQCRRIKAKNEFIRKFQNMWASIQWGEDLAHLPNDHPIMVSYWFSIGVPPDVLLDAYMIALTKRDLPDSSVWPYMIGVVKNKISEMEADASAAVMKGR